MKTVCKELELPEETLKSIAKFEINSQESQDDSF